MTRHLAALTAFAAVTLVTTPAPAQITLTQDASCFTGGVFDPDGTCVDIRLIDPITGTHQAATHTTGQLSHTGPLSLANTDIASFNTAPPAQFDPAGGIELSALAQGNQIDLSIAGSQTIFPGLAPAGTSEASVGVQLNQTFHLADTSGSANINTQWNVDLSGSMTLPADPPAGSMSLTLNFSVRSTVNGNPVETTIFSVNIPLELGDDDGIQPTGLSAGSVVLEDDFSDPDVVVRSYTASGSIFPNVSLPTGQEFQILGFALGNVNSQANLDANAALVNDFSDTIHLTVTAPDTTTFTQVPEPGSAAILVFVLPPLVRRRR